ncbi:MAG: hypothetical protein HYW01_10180 [Deltaproteobacteria bacterium]|nr:hypothetical protein [Deltaproteobacteria bacterium]
MSTESGRSVEEKKEGKALNPSDLGKVGQNPVGPIGIIMIMAYLMLFSVLMLYGIVKFWPLPPTPPANESSLTAPTQPQAKTEDKPKEKNGLESDSVKLFGKTIPIPNDEVRLFLIVAMAGSLGSLVHALRSLYWYVGNRELVRSWVAKYILLPFIGATLGVIFYFVICGGFFSAQATAQETSPFGFAAIAGPIGMFSDQAVEKLKKVAENFFAEAPKGKYYVPPKDEKPDTEIKTHVKPMPGAKDKPREEE